MREMQQLKRQKIQEVLDAQNASIDADMVRLLVIHCTLDYGMVFLLHTVLIWFLNNCYICCRITKERDD